MTTGAVPPDQQPGRRAEQRAEQRPVLREPVELGGEAACWLPRVCPECGRLADAEPPTRCPSCGAEITVP